MKIYKPTTKKDLDRVKIFMSKIIQEEFGYKLNKSWHKDIMNLKNTYIKDRSVLLIIKDGDKVVGTIAGRGYDRQYLRFKNRYNPDNTLGLWRHYVDKSYRGNGFGTILLSKVVKFAKSKGYKFLYLHTQKTIPNSFEYWIAKGFNVTWDTNDNFKTVHLEKMLK